MTQNQDNNSKKAIRLTFSYLGDRVQLVSRQNIEKTIFQSPKTILPDSKQFYYELTDIDSNILFKTNLGNLIALDREIFSQDPKESITRQQVKEISGTFSIVIPDLPQAQNLELFVESSKMEIIKDEIKPTRIFHLNLKGDEDTN